MRWMVIPEYEVRGEALIYILLDYPDHGDHGTLPVQRKIPMAEPGMEPGIS
jgi:hypothetical protein